MSERNQKESLIPIYLYMILRDKSSQKKPLTRLDIESTLKEEFNLEIHKENRKIIPRHIRTLAEHFKNLIVEEPAEKGKATTWYFESRNAPSLGGNLSVGEVNFLTDVLSANKTISSECTNALIQKLVRSLGDIEQEELRIKAHDGGAYKSENRHLLEIRNKVEEAKTNYKQVNITYETNGMQKKLTLMPVKIDQIDGKYYLRAYLKEKRYLFYLENIKSISMGEEPTVLLGNDKYDLEDENTKLSKSIALDALFTNTREINYAIKNNKYLHFKYLAYRLGENNKVKLTPSDTLTVIPINTAYKDGKPYLIAIDLQNEYKHVFYRIDLIKDIQSRETVDFLEYHKFDTRDSDEYTDKHPFMLSGFTKIRATFFIKADCLDRVVDAFGNKATYIGKKKAFETMGENAIKLARTFPELNFSKRLGFEHNEEIVAFSVETTDEEAIRFALQNGDCVELCNPEFRDRILDITNKMKIRHERYLKI